MGYTHYWDRKEKLDPNLFGQASKDCQKVCNNSQVEIQFEYNEPNPPVFTRDSVRFNGIGSDGHETFAVARHYKHSYPQKDEQGRLFTFCKTACKPYDRLVTACLVIFKHHFGDAISISSDGEMSDWKDGMKECQDVLGYGNDFTLDK